MTLPTLPHEAEGADSKSVQGGFDTLMWDHLESVRLDEEVPR